MAGKNVILLEDDMAANVTLTKLLSSNGYIVWSCNNVIQATELFKQKSELVDCIITDLNLSSFGLEECANDPDVPVLTGWVWLYKICLPQEKVPVIIFSAFIDELTERIALSSDETEKLFYKSVVTLSKASSNAWSELLNKLNNMTGG